MTTCMSPLLLELWREQHPNGHEQTMLDFKARGVAARNHRSLLRPGSELSFPGRGAVSMV
jgi:hypothetical protein